MRQNNVPIAAACCVALLLTAVQAIGGQEQPRTTISSAELTRLLDRIETRAYYVPTGIASGHNVVEAILSKTPEFKTLAALPTDANATLRDRVKALAAKPSADGMSLITYALLFKARGDTGCLGTLAQYLRALPERDARVSQSPSHPFRYVLDSVRALTGNAVYVPSSDQAFAMRHAIADQVDRWHPAAPSGATSPAH